MTNSGTPATTPTGRTVAPSGTAVSRPAPSFDLLARRTTHFVLWQPGVTTAPTLVLGTVCGTDNLCTFTVQAKKKMLPATGLQDLWELKADTLGMPDGIYHYWFQIQDTSPDSLGVMLCTDPLAYTVDYRVASSVGNHPAAVVAISKGKLVECDPGGTPVSIGDPPQIDSLPPNNKMVIYELPTSWSRGGVEGAGSGERDTGSFRDVAALLDRNNPGANFSDLPEVNSRAIIAELGANVLQCLPVQDTKAKRQWGYATAHYFAADYDLGSPEGSVSPSATTDLVKLVQLCHSKGIRFFIDIVMAFGHDPYSRISYDSYHLRPKSEQNNPDSYQSSRNHELRDCFGGESWRYIKNVTGYDPQAGAVSAITPSWKFMFAFITRWLQDFHVDGVRIDSVNNIANWSFLQEFRKHARETFSSRYPHANQGEREARFQVIGEELNVPLDLIQQRCVDALWNEGFQSRIRAAIIGESIGGENFEWTIRRLVDCRNLGFSDGAESINYIGSHDTEGPRKERLYNFLENCRVYEKEQRSKLAFACLLTSVGVPMIFAGDEFCDEQDLPAVHPSKQIDPVDYTRARHPWRARLFSYVANLIRFRKQSTALSVNETDFIHLDFHEGRRIMAWVRGDTRHHDPVVVVANFSNCYTPGPEYVINNWPQTPTGMQWKEITQQRVVPAEWAGKEPLYPWEAKVYALERA